MMAVGLAAAYRAGIAIDLATALTLLVISLVVGNALTGGNLATESLLTKILAAIGKRGGKSE
jgi:hypothetical protein